MIKLATLVRAHRRADTLRVVLSELQRYKTFPGLYVQISLLLDRPSREVLQIANTLGMGTQLSRIPVLGEGRERFLEAQNFHLSLMEEGADFNVAINPDWVYVVDDDFWFEPSKITDALVPALSNPDVDAWYCPCVFMQDEPGKFNPARQHESIRLYRHRPRARFTGKRMLSAPDAVVDDAIISGRYARFPVPILEYGGYTAAERARVIAAYKDAGKDDDFTRALLSPRRLRFPDDYAPGYGPWTSLYPCAAPSTRTTSATDATSLTAATPPATSPSAGTEPI